MECVANMWRISQENIQASEIYGRKCAVYIKEIIQEIGKSQSKEVAFKTYQFKPEKKKLKFLNKPYFV